MGGLGVCVGWWVGGWGGFGGQNDPQDPGVRGGPGGNWISEVRCNHNFLFWNHCGNRNN